MLQENLKRASSRKSDITQTKSGLSNLLLGDSTNLEIDNTPETISIDTPDLLEDEVVGDAVVEDEVVGDAVVEDEVVGEDEIITNEITSEETTDLPEPPVVVYVKEVGTAGL
jgi:hypothetical protein